jgi:hypothetical protein
MQQVQKYLYFKFPITPLPLCASPRTLRLCENFPGRNFQANGKHVA